MFRSDNYVGRTRINLSHKFYSSNGELENECEYFDWYKINNVIELKEFIKENLFNYNVIVTQNDNTEKPYKYYINYYEGEVFTMAVKDNNGDFLQMLKVKQLTINDCLKV